jgi:energy-converting hydrogenase Eha subunit A
MRSSTMPDDRNLERKRGSRFKTLGISSLASIVAAVVTSEFWPGGALGSAALTPVIVALVKDLLSPLARDRAERHEAEEAAAARKAAGAPDDPPPPPPRWPFVLGGILVGILIALVAFLLAAVILTVPEIVADKSITGGGGETTFFGDNDEKPWGKIGSWSECFDDLEQCVKDIVEQHR